MHVLLSDSTSQPLPGACRAPSPSPFLSAILSHHLSSTAPGPCPPSSPPPQQHLAPVLSTTSAAPGPRPLHHLSSTSAARPPAPAPVLSTTSAAPQHLAPGLHTHLAALDHPQGAEAHGLASILQGHLGAIGSRLRLHLHQVRRAGPSRQELPREPGKAADAHFWGKAERRGCQAWSQLREPRGKAPRQGAQVLKAPPCQVSP